MHLMSSWFRFGCFCPRPPDPHLFSGGLSRHFTVGEAQFVEVHLSSVKSWGIHHYIFTGWGWSCSKVLPSSHWSSAHVHSWGYRTCFHLHKALGKVLSNIDWPVHERPVPSHIDHFVFFCFFFFFPRAGATQLQLRHIRPAGGCKRDQ